MKTMYAAVRLTILLALVLPAAAAEPDPFTHRKPPPIIGRWDLKVRGLDREYPSWLEVRESGYRTLVGAFVGRFGSVLPISSVDFDKAHLRFVLPPQWERRTNDLVFEGQLEGDVLR